MTNVYGGVIDRISEMITGVHVHTTHGGLSTTEFTNTAQTELFNIYGRIGVKQLFIELTGTADANATTVAFNCTFTTPTIAVNEMAADCGSIANLTQGTRITFVGGAVATANIITDTAGLTDVETAGKMHILGGQTSAGANYVGTIGMLTAGATQAGSITGTAHLFYIALSKGAYAEAIAGV